MNIQHIFIIIINHVYIEHKCFVLIYDSQHMVLCTHFDPITGDEVDIQSPTGVISLWYKAKGGLIKTNSDITY